MVFVSTIYMVHVYCLFSAIRYHAYKHLKLPHTSKVKIAFVVLLVAHVSVFSSACNRLFHYAKYLHIHQVSSIY